MGAPRRRRPTPRPRDGSLLREVEEIERRIAALVAEAARIRRALRALGREGRPPAG